MHVLDVAVLVGYVLVVMALGLWVGQSEKDEDDFFLGGRQVPWLAVAISFVATTASALTFIGVPGAAYKKDFLYLQFAIGDLVGRALIAGFLLPAYFEHRVTTVYQLLGVRFGPRSRDYGTVLFLLTRILASGVRVAACAMAVSAIFGLPLDLTIWAVVGVALVYTAAGGIKAVIWTDTLQFLLFVGGAFIVLGVIVNALPGGFGQILEIGYAHDKFKILYTGEEAWASGDHVLIGSIFGLLLTFAVQGTDQDMVQRLLTTRTLRDSQKAIMLTALLNAPLTLLFLMVGASLFAYYQVFPSVEVAALVGEGRFDRVFPFFMKSVLAPGVRGLLIAGLMAAAMSSLDSALGALSSTAWVDLVKRYWRPDADSQEALASTRMLSVTFALILGIVAMGFGRQDGILWVGFQAMGLTYGTLLGLFCLGVWTKDRGSDSGNLVAIYTSITAVIALTAAPPWGYAALDWKWSIVIGTGTTLVVGALWPTPGEGEGSAP